MTTSSPVVVDRNLELAVLRRCARSHAGWTHVAGEEPIDWTYVLAMAEAHLVPELLLAPLKAAGPAVPRDVVERLEEYIVRITALNLARTRQLADVLELFGRHGIPALAFKGPALAVSLYGHLGLRSSGDLDLLIDRGGAARARPVLLEAGYVLPARPRHRGGSLIYGLYPAAGRDDTLWSGQQGLADIDLHVAFSHWTQGIRLDTRGMFDRAVRVEVAGVPIPTLCPDDMLLVLAIHGMMHGWSRLRFVSDVDALVPLVGDWEAVVHRAGAARMRRTLRVALLIARGVLDTELPARAAAFAAEDAEAIALAGRAATHVFNPPPPPGAFDPGPWFLSFQERRRDRLRFHARRLIYEWALKWPWDEWLGRRRRPAAAPRGAEDTEDTEGNSPRRNGGHGDITGDG